MLISTYQLYYSIMACECNIHVAYADMSVFADLCWKMGGGGEGADLSTQWQGYYAYFLNLNLFSL